MWVLPHYVKDTIANELNSCICAKICPALLAAFARSGQHRSCELLRLYQGVVNNSLKKYATDQAIAKCDAAVLRYLKPANMIP